MKPEVNVPRKISIRRDDLLENATEPEEWTYYVVSNEMEQTDKRAAVCYVSEMERDGL